MGISVSPTDFVQKRKEPRSVGGSFRALVLNVRYGTRKFMLLKRVPLGVVTEIMPVDAPVGTCA